MSKNCNSKYADRSEANDLVAAGLSSADTGFQNFIAMLGLPCILLANTVIFSYCSRLFC